MPLATFSKSTAATTSTASAASAKRQFLRVHRIQHSHAQRPRQRAHHQPLRHWRRVLQVLHRLKLQCDTSSEAEQRLPVASPFDLPFAPRSSPSPLSANYSPYRPRCSSRRTSPTRPSIACPSPTSTCSSSSATSTSTLAAFVYATWPTSVKNPCC